jgi:hypothetical protein
MSPFTKNALRASLVFFTALKASGFAPVSSPKQHSQAGVAAARVALKAVVPNDQELTSFDKAYLAMRTPSVTQNETRDYFMSPTPPKTEPKRQAQEARQAQREQQASWEESNRPNVLYTINQGSSSAAQTEEEVSKYGPLQSVATVQSLAVGGLWGGLMVAPVLLCHHFYFYPSYEALAQFEWDLGASLLQGGAFAAVYRYALRENLHERKIQNIALLSALVIRSGLSVHVPMECSSPHLQCELLFVCTVLCLFLLSVPFWEDCGVPRF